MSLMALAILALPLTLLSGNKQTDKKTIVLTSKNTLVLAEAVTDESVSAIMDKAKDLDDAGILSSTFSKEPIYLFLYTPGGSIQAGLQLSEALHGLNRPVDTITLFAASMGFQLVQDLGQRNIVKNGTLMSHKAYGGFEGEFGGIGMSQMDSQMTFWKERLNELDRQTVVRTKGKQTLESYQKAYENELWLTGTQSVDGGYADRVVTVRCDSSLNTLIPHTVEFMGMVFMYDTSGCPLDTSIKNVRAGARTSGGIVVIVEDLMKQGGFGASCLQEQVTNKAKVCATDLTLTPEKINEIKAKFLDSKNPAKNIGQMAAPGIRW